MKGINEELNNQIKRECLLKSAITSVKKQKEDERPINRRRIEDILEAKRIEKSVQLDYWCYLRIIKESLGSLFYCLWFTDTKKHQLRCLFVIVVMCYLITKLLSGSYSTRHSCECNGHKIVQVFYQNPTSHLYYLCICIHFS